MKNGPGWKNAVGKFKDEVETGRMGSTQTAKEGPINGGSGGIRPVVRLGKVATKRSIEVEVANECRKAVGDTVLMDGNTADGGGEKRSDGRRGA